MQNQPSHLVRNSSAHKGTWGPGNRFILSHPREEDTNMLGAEVNQGLFLFIPAEMKSVDQARVPCARVYICGVFLAIITMVPCLSFYVGWRHLRPISLKQSIALDHGRRIRRPPKRASIAVCVSQSKPEKKLIIHELAGYYQGSVSHRKANNKTNLHP